MKSIEWIGGKIRFIDQTRLPADELYVATDDLEVLLDAIRTLKIRGAPALGVAAAYGIVLGTQHLTHLSPHELIVAADEAAIRIGASRPTARNLFWALERMRSTARLTESGGIDQMHAGLLREALNIHAQDEAMCAAIGRFGAGLVPDPATIVTHCNTGALATGGEGTAQAIITTAFRQGKKVSVFADETRPLLQGARLTAWELQKIGIPVTLIADNTAAFVMARKKVDLVVVGADRIAANGDVANKVGTYNLAIIAREHGIPFYVAAPTSTIDMGTSDGGAIPIEERDGRELTEGFGRRTAPMDVAVFSPAFDVTPHRFITAIITERGILRPPFASSLKGNDPEGALR